MKDSRPRKKDWALTQEAFDELLRRLGPSAEFAGPKYEDLRRSLIQFFRSHGRHGCEDLADETIDRGARRIGEGVEIETNDPATYFIGIAYRVLHEDRRRKPPPAYPPATTTHEELENKLECREECFRALDPESRELLREYCEGDYKASVKRRRKMAGRLGISVNALRLRVYHLREGLEACQKKCLEEKRRDDPF